MSGATPRLTKRQAAIIGAFTGVLTGNFEDLAAYASERLGRPLWTHEFGSRAVADEIKEAARRDFEALLPEGTRSARTEPLSRGARGVAEQEHGWFE